MKRFVLGGAIVGLVIPLCLMAVRYLSFLGSNHYAFGNVELALWPSSFMLMATEGSHSTLSALSILGVSIAVNIALYAALGLIAFFFIWLWRRAGA